MKYNLLNAVAFRELPKVIRHLRTILDNYEYFNSISIDIVVDMAVSILNSAADIILPEGELVDAGTYTRRISMTDRITYDGLYDFILRVEDIHERIADDNRDLLQNE